ncbi:MAG: cob(I)yrinic acid a,c-diamide adenosyltransferase [Flavobacteriales bacterium]
MKIYTKKGDNGTTALLGGTRVPKHHMRIEAYGTVDELNSYIGLVRDSVNSEAHKSILLEIQDRLFTMGSHLALDPAHAGKMKLPEVTESDVSFLEREMDRMDALLPEMKNFVLPGGHVAVSHTHIARCICRRAERCVTALNEDARQPEVTLRYLNRLSDYLFVLSRMITLEVGAEEKPWVPRQ